MDVRRSLPAALAALSLLVSGSFAEAQSAPDDCSTPRQAARTFLANLQADSMNPAVAARCFAWSEAGVRGEARQEAARDLLAVLDQRGHYVDLDALPDTPEVDAETYADGKVPLTRRLPDVIKQIFKSL